MDTFFEQIISIRKNGKAFAAVLGIWLAAFLVSFLLFITGILGSFFLFFIASLFFFFFL